MFFAWLSFAFLVAATVLLVRLHLLFTGITPMSGPVNMLGETRYHPYFRAMGAALGLAAFALAVGLARATDATSIAWLSIYGGARVAIAGFEVNPRQTAAAGWLHVALVVLAFAAIAFAGIKLEWDGDPGALRPFGYVVAIAALAALVTRVVPALRGAFGVAERALYVTSIAWLGIAAVDLIVK